MIPLKLDFVWCYSTEEASKEQCRQVWIDIIYLICSGLVVLFDG